VSEPDSLPNPQIRKARWRPQWVWAVPIIAIAIGLSLLIKAWQSEGPKITIRFQSAEGIEVGKTLVRYRSVPIGRVTGIRFSADHELVDVSAELDRNAAFIATEDTKAWVVRPRIGIGTISGLEALLSGAFIAMRPGRSHNARTTFEGLETPPPLEPTAPGSRILLHAPDLGSISLGAPVYFKRLEVGHVIDERLDADGHGAQIAVFIDAPNNRFLSSRTRFWNATGLDVSLNADGFQLRTASLAAIIAGGVAFDDLPSTDLLETSSSTTEFALYRDRATAMAPASVDPHMVKMRFEQALRGLEVGAPVEFIGVNIGSVTSVDLDYNPRNRSFPVIVTAVLYPQRMGRAYDEMIEEGPSEEKMAELVGKLVAKGLRVQARRGSLLTHQLYLAMDFIPDSEHAAFDAKSHPLEIPTVRGNLDELQYRVANIAKKIDELPLNALVHHLDDDLTSLGTTVARLNSSVLPPAATALQDLHGTLNQAQAVLASDSPLQEELHATLEESRNTLREIRSLADLLNRHPEALIRGKPRDSRQEQSLVDPIEKTP
jgi:paraquat-inducible protein B